MNNCIIYDKTFLEDLIDQKNSINAASVRNDILNNLISTTEAADNVWTPLFITKDNSTIDNTLLLDKGYVSGYNNENNILGIQNFLKIINPKFNFWKTNGYMSTDWTLNRQNISYFPVHGLMCWFKRIVPSKTGKKLSEFPNNARVKLFNTSRSFVKIDEETLYETNDPNKTSSKFINSEYIEFNYGDSKNNYVKLSTIGNNALFLDSDIFVEENRMGVSTSSSVSTYSDIVIGQSKYLLWIPDGDVYSYYINFDEYMAQFPGIAPRSFCSPSLYQAYNAIYHKLTFDLKRRESYRQTHTARSYKNLSKYIATSPFIDEFSISRLYTKEVMEFVNIFINNNYVSTGIGHLQSTIECLNKISSYFSKLSSTDNDDNTRNLNNNIIYNTVGLKQKLVQKYGSKLILGAEGVVTSNKPLEYGANVRVDQFGEYIVKSEVKNAILYTNQSIEVGDLSIDTNYAETKSRIGLKFKQNPKVPANIIPRSDLMLWDSARPIIKYNEKINKINLVLAKSTNDPSLPEYNNIKNDNSPNTCVFKYKDGSVLGLNYTSNLSDLILLRVLPETLDIDSYKTAEDENNPSDILVRKDFVCKWEKVSGPPVLFINDIILSISTKGGPQLFSDTSQVQQTIKDYTGQVVGFESLSHGPEVYVAPYSTGRYQIKCTIITPYGTFVKIKTFYVTSLVGLMSPDLNNTPNQFFPKDVRGRYLSPISTSFPSTGPGGIGKPPPPIKPDPADIEYIIDREKHDIILNSKNLRVHTPIINSIAIHGRGLALPIAMTSDIKVLKSRPEKLINNTLYYLEDYYGGPIKDGKADSSYKYDQSSNIILRYFSDANIQYRLDKIKLEHIRHHSDPKCANCFSLYSTDLYGSRGNWIRGKGSTLDGWENNTYHYRSWGGAFDKEDNETFSTDFSPKIKSYGGWDNETINNIGISIPNHPDPGTVFPAITGKPLNYKSDKPSLDPPYFAEGFKYCFEDIIPDNSDKYIDFKKGVFHPQSGWISYDSPLHSGIENLSSVLKFNVGARESYSFSGPSINNIQNDSYIYSGNNLFIIPIQFKSSIEIGIAEGAQWIQESIQCGGTTPCRSDSPPHWVWLNQIHREYGDQDIPSANGKAYDHGYRILRGGDPKRYEARSYDNFSPFMDEFGFISDSENNRFKYLFPVSGPRYPPGPIPEDIVKYMSKARRSNPNCIKDNGEQPANYYENLPNPTGTWKGFRNPRVLNFSIKDIEVKLNFLNYVNTKDLSIVFDSKPCLDELYRIGGGERYKSPIAGGSIFIDQTIQSDFDSLAAPQDWPLNPININNSDLTQYLYSLSNMNTRFTKTSVAGISVPYKEPTSNPHLYLLNQEYIQNHSFNLSLKFSDHANKYNVVNDHNYNNSSGYVAANYQNIINTDDIIKPSICPFGYSDQEVNIYHNAVTANKLNITNNTFSKYAGKPMFDSTVRCPPRGGAGIKGTKGPNKNDVTFFTCAITLYDEHDDMLPNDNTINSQLYTNIYDFTNKINSSSLYSSLCSWELLLHFGDTKKPTAPILSSLNSYGNNEALSLIEYGKPPQYGGYGFMANLKNYKHMMPFVNINAPNIFFQDNTICEASDPELIGNIKGIPGVEFPWLAILAATYAYTGAVGLGGAGGLGGIMAGLGGGDIAMSIAVGQIVNYFNAQRAQDFRQAIANDIYHQDYKRYPFGSPEKILINFSKDNIFWYKAEASIFKYANSPILPYKKYNYIRLNKDTLPELSRFSVKVVENIKDLLEEKSIKELTIGCTEFNAVSGPLTYNNISYHTDDIVDVRFSSTDSSNVCVDGLYFVPTTGKWVSLAQKPSILCEKSDYITRNHVLYNDLPDTEYSIFKNLYSDINQKKLIMIDGTVPFEIFTFKDIVQVSGQNIAPDAIIDVNLIDGPTGETPSVTPTSTQPDQPVAPADTTPKYTTKILGKALIYKDKKPYTILKVDRLDMDKADFISPDNNVIVVFGLSSSTDLKNNPVNMYAFEKESLNRPHPEVYNTTNSYGSYGDGSYTINKNILSQIPMYNNIEKIGNMFNNHKSDRLLYNKMFFTKEQSEQINSLKYVGASVAYPHKLNDVITVVDNNSKYIVNNPANSTTLDNLLSNSKYFSFNNVDFNNIHLTYIRNNNFRDSSMVPYPSGYISIENDYEEKPPIEATDINGDPISNEVFQNLITRLNLLENTNVNLEVESNIGVNTIVATNKVIESYNLSYIYRHYESLTEYNSNKKISELALRVFYQERNDILKLLNETSDYQKARITIKNKTSIISGKIARENIESITVLESVVVDDITTFKENTILKEDIVSITRDFERTRHGIKPQILAKIKTFRPFDRLSLLAFQIEYEYDNDNYWINLDPHQGCSIAEELRPKVLKSITYVCRPANYIQGIYGMPQLAINNICNHKRGSILENEEDDPDGINYSKGSTSGFRSGPYETYKYTIGENIVNKNKTNLEKKATAAGLPIKWEEVTIKRNYHINGNAAGMDTINSYKEIMVTAIETYDVLLSPLEIKDNKADKTNSTQDADVLDIGNLPGGVGGGDPDDPSPPPPDDGNFVSSLPPPGETIGASVPQKSVDGFGLLTLGGIRAGQSMKIYNVCNLDNVNNLKIKFRKIPRQLRGLDIYSTVYRYGPTGLFRPGKRNQISDILDPYEIVEAGSVSGSSFQPILNNNIYYWKCMEIEDTKLVPSTTPLFFQLMNEMMYRTFYGSIDRIENKGTILKSQFLWEMIPYEFFTNTPPPREK